MSSSVSDSRSSTGMVGGCGALVGGRILDRERLQISSEQNTEAPPGCLRTTIALYLEAGAASRSSF